MQDELRELRMERFAEAQRWHDDQVQADRQQEQWAPEVQVKFVNKADDEEAARAATQLEDGRAPSVQNLAVRSRVCGSER